MDSNFLLKKILIVDGSYLLSRQLHVKSLYELKAPDGSGTGGIFGFIRALSHELRVCGDYYPIITWDEGLSPRRVAADPYYKHADERAEKDKMTLIEDDPDDAYLIQYRSQRSSIIELLSYFGVPSIKYKGYEGDDLMYILTKISEDSLVLTDDRDMLQLLGERCKVRRPMANELWDIDYFLKSRGFSDIYDFILYKAIIGDGSDNIPSSCKGVGEASVNEFIKLVYKFYKSDGVFDFRGYPDSVDTMKKFCLENDIKYKKAYLNLNIPRFITNLELVDLNKVDIEDSIVRSIISSVSNSRSGVDYFKAMSILTRFGIKEISADDFMSSISVRYRNLLVEGS